MISYTTYMKLKTISEHKNIAQIST